MMCVHFIAMRTDFGLKLWLASYSSNACTDIAQIPYIGYTSFARLDLYFSHKLIIAYYITIQKCYLICVWAVNSNAVSAFAAAAAAWNDE